MSSSASTRPVDPSALRYRILATLLRIASSARQITGLLFAFVTGIWVNAVSDPSVTSFLDLIVRIYDVSLRATAWFALAPTIVLIALPLVRLILKRTLRRADFAVALSETLAQNVDEAVLAASRGRIAWGAQLVLQSCPRIEEGWATNDIDITKNPTPFVYSRASTAEFAAWFQDDENQVVRSGRSLRLMEGTSAFTDDQRLRLRVQPTRFADVIHYTRTVAVVGAERDDQITRVVRGEIGFPHSFCLHAVVVTSDDWILFTHRSPRVAYNPETWSCSIEEQLAERDFDGTGGDIVTRWAWRMLNEELGLRDNETSGADVRILCLFLESDKINVGLVGLVQLSQDRRTLDSIISARPRQDYEFSDWKFMRWSELPVELARPGLAFHPSSGLRMFMACIVRFGVYDFGVRLAREASRAEDQ